MEENQNKCNSEPMASLKVKMTVTRSRVVVVETERTEQIPEIFQRSNWQAVGMEW